jgi:hypothetical protein
MHKANHGSGLGRSAQKLDINSESSRSVGASLTGACAVAYVGRGTRFLPKGPVRTRRDEGGDETTTASDSD